MPDKVIHEIRLNQYSAVPADRTRRFSLGTKDSYGIEQLRIVPGEGWDGLTITATFHPPEGEAVQVLVPADGLIDVPPEATRSGSELPFRYGKIVFAGVADGVQRISCNLPYTVMGHEPVDGAASSGPTPSWYEQAAAHFLPSGGKAGQVLAKASDADLDVEWRNRSTPDWTQNDPTAADYIKNRPFYAGDLVETELADVCALVDEAGYQWIDGGEGTSLIAYILNQLILLDGPFVIGEKYTIQYNGSTYECTAIDGHDVEIADTIIIGDVDAVDSGNFKTYGFAFLLYPYTLLDPNDTSGRYIIYYAAVNGTAPTELKIISKKQDIVKIDSRYIDFPNPPEETDPTVPDWAKRETKPSYTAEEVGALPNDTSIPLIVTVDDKGYADYTAKQIIDSANNGKVCILIHKGQGENVFLYGGGNAASLSTAYFYCPRSGNNMCELLDRLSGETTASLSHVSFETVATKNSNGVIRIGDGLEEVPGSDGEVRVSYIMNSSTEGSTKKFKLTVDDSGTLSAVEVTE